MRLDEINERLSAIKVELDNEEVNVEELETETNGLLEERKAIMENAEKRTALVNAVINLPEAAVTRKFDEKPEERKMEYNTASKEYRSAFLKNLVGAEMNIEERAAFTHTTGNTTAPLPATMLNEIWDLVSKQHVIMGDIKTYRTGTILEVVKHTAIVAGKAAVTAQGVANADDEQNTLVKVTLSGKDFSKHVVISYAMAAMSIDALEAYLVSEISSSLGEALADDTVATIKSGTAAANKVNTTGVKAVTYVELAKLFALLKRVSNRTIYVNNATFYNYIVSIVDTAGRPIFQPTMQDGAQGVLLGAQVKIEESVADNEVFVGDPQRVVCNMVQDILIEQDKDIKTHTNIYAGYARAESALLDDASFAILTVKQV